jgi:hypothetical protein
MLKPYIMKNKTITLLLFFVLCVHLPAHAQLQLGTGLAAGRYYSTIDYVQLNSINYQTTPGFTGQGGLELAYLLNDRWRISMGASLVFSQFSAERNGLQLFEVSHEGLAFHIPVEVQHRIPLGPKNYLVFRGGGSLAMFSTGSSEGMRSVGATLPGGERWGGVVTYNFQNDNAITGFLRLGIGQEWVLGGRRNSSIQLSLLYVQGFSSIQEGSFEYWDELPPPGTRLDREALDGGILGEPDETYSRFFSRGSHLCVELKYYIGSKRKKD